MPVPLFLNRPAALDNPPIDVKLVDNGCPPKFVNAAPAVTAPVPPLAIGKTPVIFDVTSMVPFAMSAFVIVPSKIFAEVTASAANFPLSTFPATILVVPSLAISTSPVGYTAVALFELFPIQR